MFLYKGCCFTCSWCSLHVLKLNKTNHLAFFLQIIVPQLEPLTDQQIVGIKNLRQSSQQAEDALSQGLEKLQQSLVLDMAVDPLGVGNFGLQMALAIDKFEALEGFVSQVTACPFFFVILFEIVQTHISPFEKLLITYKIYMKFSK